MLDEAAELREVARRLAKAEQDRAEVEGRWEDFAQHAQVHSRGGRACQRIARRDFTLQCCFPWRPALLGRRPDLHRGLWKFPFDQIYGKT